MYKQQHWKKLRRNEVAWLSANVHGAKWQMQLRNGAPGMNGALVVLAVLTKLEKGSEHEPVLVLHLQITRKTARAWAMKLGRANQQVRGAS